MIPLDVKPPKESQTHPEIAYLQFETLTSGLPITIASNLTIASSAAFILYFENHNSAVFWWLSAMFVFGFLRYFMVKGLQKGILQKISTRSALSVLALFAVLSGTAWTPIPLYFEDLNNSQNTPYFVFILMGMSTGAITQGLSYSKAGIGFAAPVTASTLYSLLNSPSAINLMIAFIVSIYVLMLLRTAFQGERDFVVTRLTALKATELASSLSAANHEIHKANFALKRLANSDALTGLGNRLRFNEALDAACAAGRRVALVLFDLDKFKEINDTRGHGFGDLVLQHLSEQILSVCEPDEIAVRLGGDEFAVIIEGQDADVRAVTLAQELIGRLIECQKIGSDSVQLSVSAGVACSENPDSETLYFEADAALYQAKHSARGTFRVFDLGFSRDLDLRHRGHTMLRGSQTRRRRP